MSDGQPEMERRDLENERVTEELSSHALTHIPTRMRGDMRRPNRKKKPWGLAKLWMYFPAQKQRIEGGQKLYNKLDVLSTTSAQTIGWPLSYGDAGMTCRQVRKWKCGWESLSRNMPTHHGGEGGVTFRRLGLGKLLKTYIHIDTHLHLSKK